ncbi:MAG: NFACT family protein [Acutalibacteraceae bacterium]
MPLDGAFLHCIKNEIEKKALFSRVDKIYQPSKDEFVLLLSKQGFEGRLYISAKPSSPRIQFTRQKIENPAVPPMLCMLFRKYLISAKLTAVRQDGLERVLSFDFETRNDFGDTVTVSLVTELMGRNDNIILVGEGGRIADAVRRTDAESDRRIMPGAVYEPPVRNERLDFLLSATDEIISAVKEKGGDTAEALYGSVCGISNIFINGLVPFCKDTYELSEKDVKILSDNIDGLKNQIISGGTPVSFENIKGRRDFSFAVLKSEGFGSSREYESYSEMLDDFFGEKDLKERMRSKTSSLSKKINTLLSRTERRLVNQRAELEATESRENLRIFGELIKANIHSLKTGDCAATVINYYSENCESVEIPLDVKLSPVQNAQKYFKEYRKANTARAKLAELIEKGEKEAEYLMTVLLEIENAQNDRDIAEITEELTESGYIRSAPENRRKKNKKPAPLNPIEYLSSDGFRICVGRNNTQNDLLTIKTAGGADMWFHTKDIPGAHVIVFSGGRQITDSALNEAAEIAAVHSKAKEGAAVRVDYLPAKRVKKPNGAKPGMVVYENYKTAFVVKDSEKIKPLLK